MGSKLNYAVLGSFLVFCLLIFGAFAVTSDGGEFKVEEDPLYITHIDSGTGFGCNANTTRITNLNATRPISITVNNATTFGTGETFYVNNGTANSTLVSLAGGTWKDIILKFDTSAASPGMHTLRIQYYNTSNVTEQGLLTANVIVPTALSDLANVGPIPKINRGKSTTLTIPFYINNSEDYAVTVQKVENITLLKNGANIMNYTHDLGDSTVVAANTNGSYQATVTVDPANTNDATGLYTGQLKITADNGCPNQTYNLTLSACHNLGRTGFLQVSYVPNMVHELHWGFQYNTGLDHLIFLLQYLPHLCASSGQGSH